MIGLDEGRDRRAWSGSRLASWAKPVSKAGRGEIKLASPQAKAVEVFRLWRGLVGFGPNKICRCLLATSGTAVFDLNRLRKIGL
jgi:hypothetical protein